jgi:hypothetical protein
MGPAQGPWRRIYHRGWWSIVLDVYGFLLETIAALIGVAGLVYLGYRLTHGAAGAPRGWAAVLGEAALLGIIAAWGLKGMRALLRDAFGPARLYEGQADHAEVRWITGTHRGYRVWTVTSGEEQFSVPGPDLKTRVHPGDTIRLRYRGGTRAVTDVWRKGDTGESNE